MPPEESIAFARRAQELGGDATAISLGAADHGVSALAAIPKIRQWFDEISETETAPD